MSAFIYLKTDTIRYQGKEVYYRKPINTELHQATEYNHHYEYYYKQNHKNNHNKDKLFHHLLFYLYFLVNIFYILVIIHL